MAHKKVAITGIGAICGLGNNTKEIWSGLLSGKSGVHLIESKNDDVPFDFPVKIAGYPKNFKISPDLLSEKEQDRFDLFIHYALHATNEALQMSQVTNTTYQSDRIGCILGVGMGGFPFIEKEHSQFIKRDKPRTNPFFIPSLIPNMAPGLISMRFGLNGTNYAISSACASSGHAIEAGVNQILLGRLDAVIVGGAEAVTTKLTVSGFSSMKALSKRDIPAEKASCPFSLDRDGFVIGEGSGILVIEDYDKAVARGATILAEIVGTGSSADAFHITSPHPEGLGAKTCIQSALNDAKLNITDIDYINAHGTSTPIGDKIESQAIKDIFQDHAYKLNISSSKSMTGHLLGAAAGLESVVCVLSLLNQTVTPTINLETPDPDCDLNYTPNKAQKKSIQYALNNSFGFGGTNSSLIFKRA